MASQIRIGATLTGLQWMIYLIAFSLLRYGSAQDAVCTIATEQPVVFSIDPPSGTTGTDNTLSTNYTIAGERLDQVADIIVTTVDLQLSINVIDIQKEPTQIRFHLQQERLSNRMGSPAEVMIIPNNTQCSPVSLTISLHETVVLSIVVQNPAQSGTTIVAGRGSCLPNACGDNSTTFDVIVGGVVLNLLMVSSIELVARFPEFVVSGSATGVTRISTQYQTFTLPRNNEFLLFNQTTDAVVTPSQGQRGTRITISGNNLLGYGDIDSISLAQVTIGGIPAEVITSSQTRIEIRASSGQAAGVASIQINTTQSFAVGTFDGPYVFLENVWTQIEDGLITDIIPPAVQVGGLVILCGVNLLGGGASISEITLAGVSVIIFPQTPLTSNSTLPGEECISVQVPAIASQQQPVTGRVSITADTGALVESTNNFTFAEIQNIVPVRGQPGTIVTITGVALLSGFMSLTPTVYLSGVEATIISTSETVVIVRAADPPEPVVGSGGMEITPDVFGVPEVVSITVTDTNSLTFTLSTPTSVWTYEPPGEIDVVTPSFGQFGTLVSITGTNLLSYGASLTHAAFGELNASIIESTDTRVVVRAPDVGGTGDVDIYLFSINGAQVRGDNVFEYRERGMIASSTPNIGQRGTFVTLTGSNLFGHGNNITSVTFGGILAEIDYSQTNATSIIVRVQANENITVNTRVPITITADTSAIVQSNGEIWTYIVQGIVNNIQPSIGQEGTRVTISGTNLLGGGSNVVAVFIDGVEGSVEVNSNTNIVVIMGSIESRTATSFPGQAYIMSDTGAIVFGGDYTHQASGSIDNFSPTSGRLGTIITVTGNNLLGFGTNITSVTVAGLVGMVLSYNSSLVTIQAGAGIEASQGPVQFTVNTGAVITSTMNFTYVEPGVVAEITPEQGAEGSGVLIRGTALWPSNTQLISITIGGIPVSRIVTATTSEVSVIVGPAPSMNPAMAEIVLRASDGSFVNDVFFSFVNLVISLPNLSTGREGTLIEISLPLSSQFDRQGRLQATIDDEEAEIVESNTDTGIITVRVPRARTRGVSTVDVAVEDSQRLVARLRTGFTYLPEGAIYRVTPDNGQMGSVITLEGENLLGGGAAITTAMLAGASATILSSTDDSVQVQITENPPLTTVFPFLGDVLLTADTGAIARRLNSFMLVRQGEIMTVLPPSGQYGTIVTIAGTGLLQGDLNIMSVLLAGVQANVIGNATDTEVRVEASPSTSAQTGPVEIILSSGAVITSAPEVTFEYLEPGQVMTVNPNIGTVGTRLTIIGTNLLGGGMSVVRVSLGGVNAEINSSFSSNVTVIAQRGVPVTMGDIEIVSNTGAKILRSSVWTYEELGVITSVDPPVGQRGIEVTIRGTALLGSSASAATSCHLAGIEGTVVSFRTNEVVCRAGFFPNLQPNLGSGPVQIMSDTGVIITSNTNDTTFTYYDAVIDRIEPTTGNNGTVVMISGLNLFGFPGEGSTVQSVTFGGIPADVVSSSDNAITVRVGPSNLTTINDIVRVTSSVGSYLELLDAWSYSPPSQILSVSPRVAFSGETVIVTGVNLSPQEVSSVVVIVGQTVSATAQIINSTAIEFTTGVYQSTDMSGEELPVQLVYDTGLIISEPLVTFTYNATPSVVTAVSPNAGSQGALVTITGTNLLNNQNVSRVLLAGVPVSSIIGNATEESIVVIAAAGPIEGSFGTVVIETSDGRQSGLAGNAWRYYPLVSNVSPSSGQNGTSIRVDLSNVLPLPAIESINVSESSVSEYSIDPSQQLTIYAIQTLPMSTPVGNIVITFVDSSMLVIEDSWRYLEPVTINNVLPRSQGYFNTIVTLEGGNFQAGNVMVTRVTLAGVETEIQTQTDTQLQVRISELLDSSNEPLVGPVVVTSSEGATYTSSFMFTYIQVRVDSVEPEEGQRGTRVNIIGVGLLLGGVNIDSILLGGVQAMVLNRTDTLITVSANSFPTQTNVSNITYIMDTRAEITIPNSWRYIVPGEITSVTPQEGSMGTIVTIMGTNLFGGGSRADTVLLNNIPAQSIITNFNNVVQVTAGQSANALSPGNVQIISNSGAVTESTSSVDFTYLTPGLIASATPQQGQNGTRIVIEGSFLHNGEGVDSVIIAGVEATIESINENVVQQGIPTTITVRAGRPSAFHSFNGPITIISNFNSMSVSDFNFTYLPEGVIFSVTPTQGQIGTAVTIEGENLLGGGTTIQDVYLAGVRASLSGQPMDNLVQVTAGSNTEVLLGDIVLVSDTQAYVRRVDGWSYVQPGVVADIQPPQGQFGTRITITGERLLSGGMSISGGTLDSVGLEIMSSSEQMVIARVNAPLNPVTFNTTSITLISNNGGTLTQAFPWRFLNQSDITNVSPTSGIGNMDVTITGTNLLGGGISIVSAIAESIPATPMFSNDSIVVIRTGFNTNGQQRRGDIVLESDTGARTIELNSWEYINECMAGFYGNQGNCMPCDEECELCFGPNTTDCYTCANFAILLDNTTSGMECVTSCLNVSTLERVCRDTCELDEFAMANTTENATFCQPCHSLCDPNLSCSGPEPTQCGGCRNFLNIVNQTCVEECPIGSFTDELRRCVPCDSQCVTEEGCFGSTAAHCNRCANVYITTLLMDGQTSDLCLERCPSRYYQEPGSTLCTPCDEECATGCTGRSSFDCTNCTNASFVFPNGTTMCVPTCNPNPTRKMFYEDISGVCRPCSSRCSLTGGCVGPSAFDCNGCRLVDNSTTPIPSLRSESDSTLSECVNSCPNINNTYSFYADNNTNQCEPCDRACENGCSGPLPEDCFAAPPNTGEVAAIVILVILLVIFIIAALILGLVLCWQMKKGSIYKINESATDGVEMGERYSRANFGETNVNQTRGGARNGVSNEAFSNEDVQSKHDKGNNKREKDHPIVFANELYDDVKKSEGETGSQDLLYTAMDAPTGYAVPTPKAFRKTSATPPSEKTEPPPRPAKTEVEQSKPPPRPPSPGIDGETYTDMEMGVKEVHINQGTQQDEEYSEMSPGPLLEDVYDDVTPGNEVSGIGTGKPPAQSQTEEETALLLDQDGMYEDTDTAVALVTEYKKANSSSDLGNVPQKRISGAFDKPPELPSRPPIKKRSSVPLPETPLQKSLSGTFVSPTVSPSHPPASPIGEDLYIDPIPIEECLYEAIPGAMEGVQSKLLEAPSSPPSQSTFLEPRAPSPPSQNNELPLPPKPKK